MAKNKEVLEWTTTTAGLAGILGCTTRWINQLTNDGVLVKAGRDQYPLAENVQRYAALMEQTKGSSNYQQVRTQHLGIKTQILRMELEEMAANLHRAEDVRACMNEMISFLRARTHRIPAEFIERLEGAPPDEASIRRILTDVIHQALADMASFDFPETSEGPTRREGAVNVT